MTYAMFRTCTPTIHAGVEMEIITGRATLEGTGGNLDRVLLRSTLTGDTHRIRPQILVSLAGMSEDEIGELQLDVECKCPEAN